MSGQKLSRRTFLRGVGLGSTALTAAWLLDGRAPAVHASNRIADPSWGMVIDLTRCTGCDSCALACKQANGLPHPDIVPRALDSDAYTYVDVRRVTAADSQPRTVYVKRQCMHCLAPACVSACMVGALRKTAQGPVVYQAEKCMGCRYCQYACPFGIPSYEWENPLGLISKCQLCFARLDQGEEPACAAACPNGALRFGRREALLAQARAQITSNPGRYVDHMYGEHEVGGTAMLYLSSVPFDRLGFPALSSDPIPQTAEAVMKRTPVIAVTVASAVSGIHWILQRRDQKLAQAQSRAPNRGGQE